MNKRILTLAFLCSVSSLAFASPASECQAKLIAARDAFLALRAGDISPAQQKKVKDTADEVGACVESLKDNDLSVAWGTFLKNRLEMVPYYISKTKESEDNYSTRATVDQPALMKQMITRFKALTPAEEKKAKDE